MRAADGHRTEARQGSTPLMTEKKRPQSPPAQIFIICFVFEGFLAHPQPFYLESCPKNQPAATDQLVWDRTPPTGSWRAVVRGRCPGCPRDFPSPEGSPYCSKLTQRPHTHGPVRRHGRIRTPPFPPLGPNSRVTAPLPPQTPQPTKKTLHFRRLCTCANSMFTNVSCLCLLPLLVPPEGMHFCVKSCLAHSWTSLLSNRTVVLLLSFKHAECSSEDFCTCCKSKFMNVTS